MNINQRRSSESQRRLYSYANNTLDAALTHILDECSLLEKMSAVARSVQTGNTSSATNATVRCVTAKAGGGEAARGEEAGKRGGGGGEGGREGAKASRQAGERTAGENRVIACRDNIWTRRATITQTQIVGIEAIPE
jgi:hypothetical protein